MILNKMNPDVVYKRAICIDLMNQMPIDLIEKVIETEKLPGDYIEIFDEEDGSVTKRLNFGWLLFVATNYQLNAIVTRVIPMRKKPVAEQQTVAEVTEIISEKSE